MTLFPFEERGEACCELEDPSCNFLPEVLAGLLAEPERKENEKRKIV